MSETDDLILSTLLELKSDVGEIKATTESQAGCIEALTKDVNDLKKDRDEAKGGWKIAGLVGGLVSLGMSWLASMWGGN